ncbi:MAG: hypothetical protein QOF65_1550 [Thermoleophilaceae bacterium]|jgi:hypothetical protein|nr:hypothetical protein [Thermoleophilaceae bacterium]
MNAGREIAEAFLAGDLDGVAARLGPDPTFHSPVTDYQGREQVLGVLGLVSRVLGRGEVTRALEDGDDAAVFFTTQVDGRALDGVLRIDPGSSELTLMARPLAVLELAVEELRKAAVTEP